MVNTNDGLSARCVRLLEELRNANPDIKIRVWMEAQLRELMQCLSLDQCEDLFGFSPSVSGINTLALPDIVPIIDELAQEEPEIGVEPITPPSVEKLQRSALSDDATELLKLGRRKEYIVSRYFSSTIQTEKGERIAESFRRRYADLKAQDHAPDIVFGHLQQYAGSTSEPKRQSIGLAILSYFFERCDIFEDPSDSVVQ